jgi:uncharacterized protein
MASEAHVLPEHVTATTATAAERRGWIWTVGLTAFIAFGATVAAISGHKTGPELVFAIAALVLLVFPYMAFLNTGIAGTARDQVSGRLGRFGFGLLFFLAVYLLYGVGTGAFTWWALLRIVGFILPPAVFAIAAGQRPGVVWQDFAVVACIWLPFNFGLLDAIWDWPEGQAAYVLNTPQAVDLALLVFLVWRRFDFVPLRWQVSLRELRLVGIMLAIFMLIALPAGFATGFLQVNPKLEWRQLVGQPLGIFFFIAVPEELLFRGLLQGMLLRVTGKPVVALVVASLLFGVSHWHTAVPDLRYMTLAAVAGLFYGFTYLRSRSLVVPALLHTAVDTLWALFFHV